MINTVVLVGRLTRDPELRRTSSGTPLCHFSIAVNRNIKSPGQPEADFPNITAWSRTAELVCQYMHKGSLIGVTGRLQTGSYMDKNGQRVYTTEVVADRVDFLETRAASQQYQAQGGYTGPDSGYGQGYDNSYNAQGFNGASGGYGQNSYGGYNQGYNSSRSHSGYNNSYGQNSGSGYNSAPAYSNPSAPQENPSAYPAGKAEYTNKPAAEDTDNGLDNAFDDDADLDISRDDLPF